jgi:hypothetical protein
MTCFCHVGFLIPLDRGLVRQDDVRLAVAVDVGDRQAVADVDLADLLRTELRFRRGGRDSGEGTGRGAGSASCGH